MSDTPNGLRTIDLHGKTLAVVLPQEFAIRRELVSGMQRNTMRGACALIGYCLPDIGLKRFYQAAAFDAMAFGGIVWEKLVQSGVDEKDLPAIGLELFEMVKPLAYPSEPEVQEAVGFTSPLSETPTERPSPSPASGEGIPPGS